MRNVDAAEADPELLRRVEPADYRARVERIMLIEVEAFDWNCPQHITPRYTAAEFEALVSEGGPSYTRSDRANSLKKPD
jgi:uncharacterized protein